ncbi:unnamed protein product [Didymodactylos carnosus]|uniref:Uncharacterized protein n=1 Tax=Didymodactylos carnosus TaxID=1234261 RepID=A0A815FA35_9BILA|nr:unnamed protein product [Didymodactylos carnosus]CAF4170172.1 unnamed protein product [Didymodactylos carnosus]
MSVMHVEEFKKDSVTSHIFAMITQFIDLNIHDKNQIFSKEHLSVFEEVINEKFDELAQAPTNLQAARISVSGPPRYSTGRGDLASRTAEEKCLENEKVDSYLVNAALEQLCSDLSQINNSDEKGSEVDEAKQQRAVLIETAQYTVDKYSKLKVLPSKEE